MPRLLFLTIPLGLLICSAPASASTLYVSDLSFGTVQVFDGTTGAFTGSLTPNGGWGEPSGIAIAPNGNVYVADMNNNQVDMFDPSGNYVGAITSKALFEPTGLAFGPNGDLYVANFGLGNNSYIAQFDPSGKLITGSFATGLYDPEAMVIGPDGNLYVADSSNDTVDQILLPSGTVNFLNIPGCPQTPFTNPQGVAFGPNGNLYVSDAGFGCSSMGDSGVYEYTTSGTLLETFIATNILSTPIDLVFGPDGNLYVTDSGARVAEFDGTTGTELPDFVANGGSMGPLVNPTFLAFSSTTPEPSTMALIGLGLAAVLLRRRRKA